MAKGFFFNADEDERLAQTNAEFWESLISHVRSDGADQHVRSILDVGCHYGGLLARLAALWRPTIAWGMEPLAEARARCAERLGGLVPESRVLDVHEWPSVPSDAFDLLTSHEMLYLERDLSGFMQNVARVLSPSGRAYVVLGCHPENPVWAHWKPRLVELGHEVFDHRPMDILAAAGAAGLLPSVRPLRQAGWVTHDPNRSEFSFTSVAAMLEHHFKHKLIFRLTRR